MYSETLGLSESAFTILRDLIHERTGLFFDESKRDTLADRLSLRVVDCGLDSFLDYYYLLKYESAADEWQRVMDALSVPETFFWREIDAVHTLVRILLPNWTQTHRSEPLRIWSAGCATGEEPLTIAMALQEAGWFERVPISILASDASPAAIEKARRGVYRQRSFRNLPSALHAKYFTEVQDGWQVDPQIHARVTWGTANITAEADVSRYAAAPIIFCRNVFIYFSADAIRRTVGLFWKHMLNPGYLFVGVSESLVRLTDAFELQELGGAFVYVKR
jgi:chemotaxis protein methyltransferase CheR